MFLTTQRALHKISEDGDSSSSFIRGGKSCACNNEFTTSGLFADAMRMASVAFVTTVVSVHPISEIKCGTTPASSMAKNWCFRHIIKNVQASRLGSWNTRTYIWIRRSCFACIVWHCVDVRHVFHHWRHINKHQMLTCSCWRTSVCTRWTNLLSVTCFFTSSLSSCSTIQMWTNGMSKK